MLIVYEGTLQMLGCISKPPSPEPEIAPSSKTKQEEEIRNLRVSEYACSPLTNYAEPSHQARLARLERDHDVKPLSSGASSARVKRERVNTDGGSRKRSRRSSSIEVVDLTLD